MQRLLNGQRCSAADVVTRDVAVKEARLTNELADHKVFPVLHASVSYRF